MHHHVMRAGGQRFGGAPLKKSNYKMQGGMNYSSMNFNANQMLDNPGYVDFSDPTPLITNNGITAKRSAPPQQQQQMSMSQQNRKSTNTKNKQANKRSVRVNQPNIPNNNWHKNRNNPPGGPGGPLPMPGLRNRPPMPGPPISPHGYQPPHMRPPLPVMARGGMPPPPPFVRRSGRGAPLPMPPRPPLPLAMVAPPHRMPRGMPPPMPYGNGAVGGKIKKPNTKVVKKAVKGKSSIRTLKNIVNQYPLDKPWVTEEVRAEHAKKIDIENRLKGNKDDNLFAQFKVQRDKFVALYETEREKHLKQEAAAVKAKETIKKETENQTTETDANC